MTLAESVRSVTATVGNAYAKVLDKMELKDLSAVLGPFEGAVARSENLEHFHVYWRRNQTPACRVEQLFPLLLEDGWPRVGSMQRCLPRRSATMTHQL